MYYKKYRSDTRTTVLHDEHTVAVHMMRYVGSDAVGHHLTPTPGLCSLCGITFKSHAILIYLF